MHVMLICMCVHVRWCARSEQQCNNFALKFMRGYFHDFQTADIEGSILSETNMTFNTGLCRWAQYVNALSDATGCDPGSIIAMGGQLSYKACGVDMWQDGGEGRLSPMAIGRGCGVLARTSVTATTIAATSEALEPPMIAIAASSGELPFAMASATAWSAAIPAA